MIQLLQQQRRRLLSSALLLSALLVLSCGQKERGRIVLSAPFGPLAYPFVYMVESAQNSPYDFVVWSNPDQLRAMITGGQADFFALPTNVAAIFHNKGADISLVGVSVWSVLWMVSTDSTKTTLGDFRGEEILMPFRGDMPHIVFSTVARQQGLEPERDFRLRYVATPQDAVQQLLLGRAQHAVLCEPDLSILMYRMRAGNTGDGSVFYRVIDLQDEWRAVFDTGKSLPIGGVAAPGNVIGNAGRVRTFQKDYARAVTWCVEHPEETADLVARFFEGVPREPIVEAIRNVDQHYETAAEARPALEAFYGVLMDSDPAMTGGKLPGDGFYRGE